MPEIQSETKINASLKKYFPDYPDEIEDSFAGRNSDAKR